MNRPRIKKSLLVWTKRPDLQGKKDMRDLSVEERIQLRRSQIAECNSKQSRQVTKKPYIIFFGEKRYIKEAEINFHIQCGMTVLYEISNH